MGALVLVTPHQFGFLVYMALKPLLWLWGSFFLLAGFSLFAITMLPFPRRLSVAVHLLAAALLFGLAIRFSAAGGWLSVLNHVLLGLGIALAGFLPLEKSSRSIPAFPDLFSLLMGVVAILTGVLLLVVPRKDDVFVYISLQPTLSFLFGLAFLGAGLILAFTQLAALRAKTEAASSQAGSPGYGWPAHTLVAGVFIAFLLAASTAGREWIAAAFYGIFGLLLALLPFLRSRSRYFSPTLLRSRLSLILAVIIIFPLILAAAFIVDREEVYSRQAELRHQETQAVSLVENLAEYINFHRAALHTLVSLPALASMASENQSHLLETYTRSFPDVNAFSIYRQDGSLVASSNPSAALTRISDEPFFKDAQASGQPAYGVLPAQGDGSPVLVFGAPFWDETSQSAGIATFDLPLQRISEILRRQVRSTYSSILVVDTSGRVLVHPNSAGTLPLEDLSADPRVSAFFQATSSGSDAYYNDGAERLAGYAPVPGLNWVIIVDRPTEVALEGIYTGREFVFGVLMVFLLITVVAGSVLAGWLAAPLLALTQAVTEMASGNTTAPLPRSRVTEIDHLAVVFDQMRTNLEARTAEREAAHHRLRQMNEELGVRVVERTAELQQTNQQLAEANERYLEANQQLLQFNEHLQAEINERKRVAKALRTSEARLRVALSHAGLTVFSQDKDLCYTWAYNLPEQIGHIDLIGKRDADLFPPEEAAQLDALKRRVFETGEGEHSEIMLTFGAEKLYFDHIVEAVRDADGVVTGILGSAAEITGRKLAEQERESHLERLNTLIQVSTRILAPKNPDELLQALVDAACELTGASLAMAGIEYQAGRLQRCIFSNGRPASSSLAVDGLKGPLGELYQQLANEKLSLRLSREQVAGHPGLQELFESTGKDASMLPGLLAARLSGQENRANGLVLVAGGPRVEFNQEDEALLVQLASLASLSMQHIAARTDAEQRADEMDVIIESMTDSVVIYNRQGLPIRANRTTQAVYGFNPVGYDPNEIMSRLSIRYPDGRPVLLEDMPSSQALNGGMMVRQRFLFVNAQGEETIIHASSAPIFSAGVLSGAVVVWHDVTGYEQLLVENERQTRELQRQTELMQTIFEADPSGLAVVVGEQLNFLFVNPAYQALTPYPDVSPLGRSFEEVWPPEEDFRGGWLLQRVLDTGKPVQMDRYAQRFPDGSTRYFSMHMRRLPWMEQPAALLVMWETTRLEEAYDWAEQSAAEARRRAAEAEEGQRILEALMEYVPEGITIADAQDVTVHRVSRFGQDLAGRPIVADDGDGIPLEHHLSYWDLYRLDGVTPAAPEELPLTRATVSGEVVRDEEWILRHPDGTDILILCNAGPIRDPEGNITGGIITYRDITERKKAEEAVRSYATMLERSNRELQDFAFIASHDLQEPLRKIQAFGERLQAKHANQLGKEGADFISRMQSAAIRMQSMINDLLAYSRVTTKGQPFDQVDLNQVAQEVVSDLEVSIERNLGRVEIHSLPVIQADRLQTQQLLQNLISNALKFHRADVPPHVRVKSRQVSPQLVQILVEDNGIGFEEEYLDRIFQPFQRLHGRSEYEGTGIGLAICRKIVERHHGHITAQSTPGAGTTFVITLPVRQPEQAPPQ